jgi:hypothetical protein
MNRTLARLAERRHHLVAQAAAQRAALAHNLEPWRPRLAVLDQGVAAARYLGRHPGWLVGAALLLVALRPRRAGKWLQRGWLVWQVGRRLHKR